MKKSIWWLVVIVVIGSGGYMWYGSTEEADAGINMLDRTAVARRGDLVVSITATGVVKPIERVEVKSKASGEIITLPIEEGDVVKKGDLIARLDRTTAQNDYDQNEAALAVAKATLRQRDRRWRRVF